jgi:hypothetical protein
MEVTCIQLDISVGPCFNNGRKKKEPVAFEKLLERKITTIAVGES